MRGVESSPELMFSPPIAAPTLSHCAGLSGRREERLGDRGEKGEQEREGERRGRGAGAPHSLHSLQDPSQPHAPDGESEEGPGHRGKELPCLGTGDLEREVIFKGDRSTMKGTNIAGPVSLFPGRSSCGTSQHLARIDCVPGTGWDFWALSH
jgi:hypothetical protein